ncbi:ubiquinone biosynthesis monooxygenase COQ6, mitochondrial [Nilaparvata lugens]|uniref:ubiquinone biosynthesis monooxygenase COQ6, mitochondrial n=1 Tax=Nilaparvata lugens TaxID=108931 RepID=UPI00193E7F88|nr:ubiquinone biosynthesis monooxygenase COQ6, mitochondrial [Nilaparvata lugens]
MAMSTFAIRRFGTSAMLCKPNKNIKSGDFDVIISGGGMIGSSTACALAKSPLLQDLKVLLIEKAPKSVFTRSEKFSNRVSALSPGSKRFLESLGIWDHIAGIRYKCVRNMKVWGSGSESAIDFCSSGTDVAYIVENNVILAAIENELSKLTDKVTVLNGRNAIKYELPQFETHSDASSVNVQMEDGNRYSCKLLLGTDGFNSKVREAMGVQYISWKYNQSAVVATLKLKKDESESNSTAWQRFLPTGPIALLPLTDDTSSLVWTTTPDLAQSLLRASDDEFVAAINKAFTDAPLKNNLIELTRPGVEFVLRSVGLDTSKREPPCPPRVVSVDEKSRASFPLGFGHSTSYTKPGAILLGDAAHRVHPLAGQGVNLGFGDVECLAQTLSEAVQLGKPISANSSLSQFESNRQKHNVPTMLAIDMINKIYSTNNTAAMAVGNLAIHLTNALTPFKNLMIKQASA